MNEVYKSKYNCNSKRKLKKGIRIFITQFLLSIIFVLSSLIFVNVNEENKNIYKTHILSNDILYNDIHNIWNKYFGKVLPSESSEIPVFSDKLNYSKIDKMDGYEKISFESNSVVNAIQSGIVVFIGEKDNFGSTVIVQGVDDVDVWYGNLDNVNVKLYDYIEKNNLIGDVNEYMNLKILKENKNILYEEYIKNI